MSGKEDDNAPECKLLSGNFAIALQILLGLIAISVLVFKRVHEVPQRPLMIWAFDAAKQMVGATCAHVANLLIAILLYSFQGQMQSNDEAVDQCALYFVNFTLDTTFGIFLNYVLLSAVIQLAYRFQWSSLQTPGDYGIPIQLRTWVLQVFSWLFVIMVCKFIIALLIVAFQKPLVTFAGFLFQPLYKNPDIELAIVMIACPCLMNALQFWIQDNFLKKDVRDESFIVAQAPLSPTQLFKNNGTLPTLNTPTDEESTELSLEIIASSTLQNDTLGNKNVQTDLHSV
ncbi:hypothetical protein CCR75_001031 [Bremia lactucae]|uniref:Vacuolar membrane protein n=1 Tax=Bremia lactucae TaxID=4779 RepID=A0A976IIW2_BRELC|nr:hypothetical protein CCR75_001031 [Bremia lactucae]